MEQLINEFMSQDTFAVAGSFKNKNKYAYKVFESLFKKGKTVYPVNPQINMLEQIQCYHSVLELPEKVDVINLVTPFELTEKIVKQCIQKGITRVWMQPGAESETAINFCNENNIKVIHNICMILQK